MSQESRIMLAELLLAEKEDTRVWLRTEMDRLVDPMLHSLFERLETKLTNGMKQNESSDGDASVDPFVQVESANVIPQPSTSTSFHPNPQYVHAQFTFPLSSIPLPPVFISNSQTTLPYELTNVEASPMPIKHEIEAVTALIENEQSMDQNIANLYEEDDEEDECDCDDCVNGGIEGIKQEDGDSDSVEWVNVEEDREQSSFRPVKRPRLGTNQPHNAQTEVIEQCSRQVTQPNQVNNHDKRIITLSLQCLQSDCLDTFPEENQLNQHMSAKHDIGPFQCLLKDCLQSFDDTHLLGQHLRQSHQHSTQLHCHKCDKHYTTYHLLFHHNREHHQFGHFQCSFPLCTFTGEYRGIVHKHYTAQHKLTCEHPHCQFETSNPTNLKVHQRIHSGRKPYRCKWLDCNYSSARKSDTIRHISRMHFASKPSSVPNGEQPIGEPKDYVEMVDELL